MKIRAKINANPIANNPASLSKVELKIIKKKNEKPKTKHIKIIPSINEATNLIQNPLKKSGDIVG